MPTPYQEPSAADSVAFRAERLSRIAELLTEVAPNDPRSAQSLARLEAISCPIWWQDTYSSTDKELIRAALRVAPAQGICCRCNAHRRQPTGDHIINDDCPSHHL